MVRCGGGGGGGGGGGVCVCVCLCVCEKTTISSAAQKKIQLE